MTYVPTRDEMDPTARLWQAMGDLPSAREAEVAVLSACLQDPAAVARLDDRFGAVSPDDAANVFRSEGHRHLWRAMVAVTESDVPLDPLTLSSALERRGTLTDAGGREYVGFLIDAVPTAANVDYHARQVTEAARRCALIGTAVEAIGTALAPGGSLDAAGDILHRAAAPLVRQSDGGFTLAKHLVWPTFEAIEAVANGGAGGVLTGYPEIDDTFHGFRPGDLIVSSHASGNGKTAFMANVLANTCLEHGTTAGAILAEGTAQSFVQRLLAILALVDTRDIRSGAALRDPAQTRRMVEAGKLIASMDLHIDEAPLVTMSTIARRLRALKAENPALSFVALDYLQLVQGENGREGRARELDLIVNTLKGLAIELKIAIWALAQPDAKTVESRETPKPDLRDIAWSQAIRQAADFVLMGWLPHNYDATIPANEHRLEIEVAKGRDLPCYSFTLEWHGPHLLVDSAPRRSRRRRAEAAAREAGHADVIAQATEDRAA